MDDTKTEEAILAKGLTAPRITSSDVNNLKPRVAYITEVPAGTTSTFCHAYLVSHDGSRKFYLTTGHSACVSPENFDAEIGYDVANTRAQQQVHDMLWQLEGYALFKSMDVPTEVPNGAG